MIDLNKISNPERVDGSLSGAHPDRNAVMEAGRPGAAALSATRS